MVLGAKGHCVPYHVFRDLSTFSAALGAITDATLAILPFFFLWNMNMDLRTKMSVCTLLGLGVM
jgi:hypothetical protein